MSREHEQGPSRGSRRSKQRGSSRFKKKVSGGRKVTLRVLVLLLLGGMAYGGGIGWQKWRSSRVALETRTMVGEVAPEQKAEALRLIDEAA